MDEIQKSPNVNKIRIILNDLVETEDAPSHEDMKSCKEMIQDYFLNREPGTFVNLHQPK